MRKTLNEKRNMKVFIELHQPLMKMAGLRMEVMFEILYNAGFLPRYLIRRHLQFPWQNPYKDSAEIQLIRDKWTLEKLMDNIEKFGGLLMVKDISEF